MRYLVIACIIIASAIAWGVWAWTDCLSGHSFWFCAAVLR